MTVTVALARGRCFSRHCSTRLQDFRVGLSVIKLCFYDWNSSDICSINFPKFERKQQIIDCGRIRRLSRFPTVIREYVLVIHELRKLTANHDCKWARLSTSCEHHRLRTRLTSGVYLTVPIAYMCGRLIVLFIAVQEYISKLFFCKLETWHQYYGSVL